MGADHALTGPASTRIMPSRRPGLALDNPCVPVSEKTLASKDLLESLRKALSRLELPDGLQAARSALSELPGTIVNLERRLADGASSPIRVALFGPTGVGKSKIFNSLLGSVVSPAGFKRPFTMRPVYSVHEAHSRSALRRYVVNSAPVQCTSPGSFSRLARAAMAAVRDGCV